MKFAALLGVPRPQGPAKDDAVARIEEHLRRAAGIALFFRRRVLLEDEADITNARSDIGELPRLHARAFEVERGREIPRDARALLQGAGRMAETVELKLGIEGRFAHHLNDVFLVEKLRLEPVMEIPGKEVDLSLVGHVGKQGAAGAQNFGGRSFRHERGWR
jgi:hypothetical protein